MIYRLSFLFSVLCCPVLALSQDASPAEKIVRYYDLAIQAGNSGDLDKGISLCDRAIGEFSDGALEKYGPVFGHFYYIKGMYLLRKKQYQAAIPPLRTCYEEWDNSSLKIKVPDGEEDPRLPNRFHVHALMQWGNALMSLKNYDAAAGKYEKTLAEDPRGEPPINRLAVSINLARSYILGGQPAKGKDFIVRVIDEDLVGIEGQQQLFMILAWDWSHDKPFAEVRDVITPRASLITDDLPMERATHNPRFEALASKALEGDEPIRALMWYSLMAPQSEILKALEERKVDINQKLDVAKRANRKDIESIKSTARKLLSELDKEVVETRKSWASTLVGTGAAHYQLSSIAGARATYRLVANEFPNHPKRATILHNLVVCDVNLEFWTEAYTYGLKFFEEFPENELKPSVARVLVEVVYLQGEYQEAYTICHEIRSEMDVGSEIREIPDFVVGACAFHLGKFEEAERHLEGYFKNYPDPQRKEPAEFYLGSTKVNLMKWEEAAVILEKFLVDYPNSMMRPPVLFLSGLSHFVLEDLELALTRIKELQEKFPEAAEIPASHNVKGDILAALDESYDSIAPEYLEAKRLVEGEGRGSNEVAAYSLRQLIAAAAEAEDWEASAAYYDEFKAKYWESSYQIDATLSVLDALVALDRREEGLKTLTDFVNRFADAGDEPAQVDLLFGSYLDYLDANYTMEEKLEQLENYPFTNPANPPGALDAWLVMAKLETLEDAENQDEVADQIRLQFFKLNALYERNGKDLSSYTLVRLARWNWEVNGRKDEAREVYEFILTERPDTAGDAMGFALVDLGKLEAESAAPEIQDRAFTRFQRVLTEVENPQLREEAALNSARILTKQKKWPEAQAAWRSYLKNRGWTMARPEANYSFGLCMDEQGKDAEALKIYVSVYANFAGHLDWSTEAYLRTAEILREQNRTMDSLKVLQDMMKRMGHHDHPNIAEGKSIFFKWRDELVSSRS
tara:strand:+ start:851 stop:3760 length:2910 start_codon:yes stop_codon:yes gene_type:complete